MKMKKVSLAVAVVMLLVGQASAMTDFYAEMRSESAGLGSDAQVVYADNIQLARHEPETVPARKEAVEKKEKHFSFSGEAGAFAPYVDEYTGEKVSNRAVAKISASVTHDPTGAYLYFAGYSTRKEVDKASLFVGKSAEIGGLVTAVDFGAGVSYFPADQTYFVAYVSADFKKVWKFTPFIYAELDNPGNDFIWKGGVKSEELIPPVKISFEVGGSDGKPLTFARGTASTETKVFGQRISPWLAIQKGFGGVAEREWRTIIGLTFLF